METVCGNPTLCGNQKIRAIYKGIGLLEGLVDIPRDLRG